MLASRNATNARGRSVLRLLGGVLAGGVGMNSSIVRAQGTSAAAQPVAGWVFTPSISFGGPWDDNVLLVNPGTNPPSDYGSPIGPSASLGYTGKRTRFSTGYSGSMMRYVTLDDLNSFQQSLRATVEHRYSPRLSFHGRESFASAPT